MNQKKSTDELTHGIAEATNISDFIKKNKDEMKSETLSEYLGTLLKQKGITKTDVIDGSDLHQVYAYQIFSGRKNPSRDKLLAIAFGFKCNLEEVQTLLKHARQPELYSRIPRDAILIFAFQQEMDILNANEQLYDNGFEIIK